MSEDFSQPNPAENNNSTDFESDTQRIIHRHLSDPNDIITEEDIKNVRIGMMPPDDPDEQEEVADRFEQEIVEVSNRKSGADRMDQIDEEDFDGDRLTPWDTIEKE